MNRQQHQTPQRIRAHIRWSVFAAFIWALPVSAEHNVTLHSTAACDAKLAGLQIQIAQWPPAHLQLQAEKSKKLFLENIISTGSELVVFELPDGGPTLSPQLGKQFLIPAGTVLAAKSNHYLYDWERDAGLAGLFLATDIYSEAPAGSFEKAHDLELLHDFIQMRRVHQLHAVTAPGGLAQAKYNLDGSPYLGPWAHVQIDGVAMQALVVARLFDQLAAGGMALPKLEKLLVAKPNDATVPIDSGARVFYEALNYLVDNWRSGGFDIWEEIKTSKSHFYTLFNIREALLSGSVIVRMMGDVDFANRIDAQIQDIQNKMRVHEWAPGGFISSTVDPEAPRHAFKNGLDLATVMGSLYFSRNDGFYSLTNPWVLGTVGKMIEMARRVFPGVNPATEAPIIPRYEGDLWDGYVLQEFFAAHGWSNGTSSFAEFTDRVTMQYLKSGVIEINGLSAPFFRNALNFQTELPATFFDDGREHKFTLADPEYRILITALIKSGGSFLERVVEYAGPDGNLREQMSREVRGRGTGPENLTWSHLAYLRAFKARTQLMTILQEFL